MDLGVGERNVEPREDAYRLMVVIANSKYSSRSSTRSRAPKKRLLNVVVINPLGGVGC